MIFSSLIFTYAFLPLCLILYGLIKPLKGKNAVLIVCSLFFYAWGEPVRVGLLLLSAVVNYFVGIGIGKIKSEKGRKGVFAAGLVFNIGMIAVIKYSGFLMTNVNAAFGASLPVPDIAPLAGISFYTFQIISYIVDCYWEKVEPQQSFFKLLLYISLFPQLIAGPIVRYSTIAEEIDNRRTTLQDYSEGFTRFVIGLAKKVVLADQLNRIVEDFLGANVGALTVGGTWYGIIVYTLYIYFDFSGYSDMAIGIGRVFGFHFNENFDHPYLCKDIAEFWQRWHISLGTFFRDYLMPITFFGHRNKYLSLALVWLCTGVWHGASWNFILWGVYYGLFMLFEELIGKKRMKKIPIVIRHIYTKLVIIIGYGIFYFDETKGGMKNLGLFLRNLTPANPNGWGSVADQISLYNNLFLIIVAVICTFPLMKWFGKLSERSVGAKTAVSAGSTVICMALLILSSILMVDATTNAFLYWHM